MYLMCPLELDERHCLKLNQNTVMNIFLIVESLSVSKWGCCEEKYPSSKLNALLSVFLKLCCWLNSPVGNPMQIFAVRYVGAQ